MSNRVGSHFGAIPVGVLRIFITILSSILLVNGAKQNPLKDPKICGRPQCDVVNPKFAYSEKLYKYDYIIDLRTEFSGTGQNTSDLYLKASVDLIFPKPCEGFLRITNVQLWDTPQETSDSSIKAVSEQPERDFYDYYTDLEATEASSNEEPTVDLSNLHPKSAEMSHALKEHLLRFSFHDGLISEVCPDSAETAWVLNIKKGILSTLQNTMMRFDVDFNTTETDVTGTCNVGYALENMDNMFVTIRKVKDIGSCRNRYSTHSILQTTPYNFREDKTIWPILNSDSYCNLTIDSNLYRDVSCYERHQLIPFSNSSTGAVTISKSRLTYKGEESFATEEFLAENNNIIEKRSSLIFDHTPAIKPTHGEIKASRELLKEMCALGFPNIQREFIDVFTNFLRTTKSLDYKALTQLLARSASICKSGKNHVLESLPYIGSTASYQLMRDQIIANAISKHLAHNWMSTLSFIQRPDEETLETFYTILEFSRKKIDPEYTLGASSVIHSYCRHNPDCASNLRVKRITNLLETEFLSLFNMYRNERRTRERMIIILKGLGNIGVFSDQFAEQLQEIIVEDIAPVDIRLEAVMAFRRVDCAKYRQFFMDTYANFTINSELRIYTYLQAMRCPDYHSISKIKEILEREEINQVGSYVWSHLKNIAKSSSPVRIEAQGLLLNDDLSNKFKLDIRKFSRNYEHSLFFDEYNFGTTSDMNLIFGTDSYLPRIASFNFTADLFGQSVNFFEITARAEGFEELATSVFGPKGPLNRNLFRKKFSFLNRWLGNESYEDDDTLENFFNIDNLRLKRATEGLEVGDDTIDDDYDFEEDLNRVKRSTDNPVESRKLALQRQVDNLGYKLKYNYNNPRAQVGFRIFGNDLRYYSVEGILEVMALFKEFDPFEQIANILSGNEFTYTKSRVFLDASYNVPLAIGLPLSINAFGASSVDLRISGNLERMDPSSDWYFDIEGKFKPSISVDVITTMQSDMFYAISGIRVKSNLYSNSELEAKLKVRGKNLVSFSFDLPQESNEIFSARSELLVMKESSEIPQEGIENRRSNSTCTWPVLDDAVGLKMCSYFSVPDLSNASDTIYPGLLLSGPLNFSVVLTKSDPTAKRFIFEYKWDQQENESDWSLIFHTPGSAVKRLLVANVTTTPASLNASVTFENGAKKALAGCVYKGDLDNRHLDLFLDANGNRSLDLNMELKRFQDRTAWVYKPRVLLAVNGVNITGLVGTIRINEKSGIMQNDFDLSFETRKLQALLRGNIIQTEITTSTNMTINYRFQANKIETINFAGRLVNKGDKSKTEYLGNVKLKTSAYPKLNFVSNATWLTLQGHTEGIITYNNAPNFVDPNYTSSVRLIFARSYSDDLFWEGSRTRASLEVKVPRSKVDYRILVKHEERSKNGTEHNFIIALRYAPEKEATGLFSVHLPRRSLLAVDAYMNVTIPEFNSCTARLKLTERYLKDYIIHLNGSWFSGHSISIKGNYKDKSSHVQALHHLKLIVESPSFAVTTLNLVYRRNQLIIFADIQAKYDKDPYGLTLQYAGNAENKNTNAEARLKIRNMDYWISAKLLSEQPKMIQVELHLDKLRDIHLKLGLLSLEKRKELSLEFKWDANRDPSQRLGLLAEYNNVAEKRYDGNVMITYPDRTISCGFDAFTGGPKYFGSARASWSVNEIIVFNYDAGIMPGKILHNWVNAELTTPFDGWRRNSIIAGVYNDDNLILANSSMLWANNQSLDLLYKSDYLMKDALISFDVRLGINSTVKNIPSINVKVKHWQDVKKFDTEIYLRYSAQNISLSIYSIKSNWEVWNTPQFQNISGTVLLLSPFEGYRKGGLAAKFSVSDKREVSGAASLNFDIREFTLAMDGYVKKFTNNMLTINITTPLEKYRTINGRFGLNEKEHHAVAEVRAPSVALGVEALCDIKSLLNFNVRLSIATPIESFQQAGVVAKVNPDTVDLRGMWNNVTLGFTGVWRMYNLTDFEYSYRVFTPLHGFEENGLVAKFIKSDVFILQLHGTFSHYKLGLKINGRPKSKLLKQLGGNKIELEVLYDDDFQPSIPDESEDYDIDTIDYDEFFSYFVEFELDTLVWPTINGVIDAQEIMDFYLIVGNLQLPQGRVDIKDRLHFPDYINVLNVLNLNTPFQPFKDVKSIVEYHIDLNYNYFFQKIYVCVKDELTTPTEVGFQVNYTKVDDALKPKQHQVNLTVQTPFELLPQIDIVAKLELEESLYRGNVTSKTANTYLSLAASVETEENFLESSVGIVLNTNVVPHYGCKAYFKKDFSLVDHSIDIQFEVTDNGLVNKLQIASDWQVEKTSWINAKGKVLTTMLPLKLAESSIYLTKGTNPQLKFDLAMMHQNGTRIEYGTRASKKKDIFNVEIWTPMRQFRNISMHGTLVRSIKNPQEYIVNGELYRNMATYGINGIIKMAGNYPADTRLRIQPKAGGRDGVIELSITEASGSQKGLNFQFSAIEDGQMCQISGGCSINHDTGIDFSVLVQSSEPEIARININGKLSPKEKGRYVGELALETPWRDLGIESVVLQSDVGVNRDGGRVQGEYHIGENLGRASCTWSWIIARDMQLILESYMERPHVRPRVVYAGIKYLNPNKSFKNLLTSGKLNLDSKWNLEINGTVNYRSSDDFQMALVTQLPPPVGDVHQLSARYRGNLLSKSPEPNVFFEGKYESEEARRRFLTRMTYRNVTDLQGLGHVEWGNIDDLAVIEGDFQMLRKLVRREFYAKLITPKFKNEDTFFLSGNYDLNEDQYHNLICSFDYPASRRIAEMDIAYMSFTNMHGFVNSSTPFLNVTWLKGDFNFSTHDGKTYRFCRGTWPSDSAFFKLNSNYVSNELNHDLQGNVAIEVPLATRHRADIDYKLNESDNTDMGHVKVIYNDKKILDGLYKRTEDYKHPLYKDITDITLDNDMKPLGIHYTHTLNVGDTVQSQQALDVKHVEVFELHNAELFNLTGELHMRSILNGKEFKILAIHPNRTVVFTTTYEQPSENLTKQRSKLQLSKTAWIGYNFEVGNFSQPGNDSQNFVIELSYPKRTLSTQGWYYVTEERFDSDIVFKWNGTSYYNDEQKSIRAGLLWKMEPLQSDDRDNQTIIFTVGHPLLEKDATFKGTYYRGIRDLIRTHLLIDYSESPEQLIEVGACLTDLYHELGFTNYIVKFFAHHNASELGVEFDGSAIARPSFYKAESHSLYKREYYPDKNSEFLAKLDLTKKEVEYLRVSPYRTVRFWAIPTSKHPVYGLNATIWDTPDTNNTGYFYINMDKKYTRMEVNLSEDASQNLQMVGYIPDTRSGYLDIWRNYEEIRVIDVSSYLKMNHSRLITGRFHWRPTISDELRNKVHAVGTSFYNSFSDGIDFWLKAIYSETMESVGIVWDKSKEYNKEFFNDIGELSVIEEDLNDLRMFINQSYEANDFYIKTVVSFTITILDELAIRDHIESLPKIFSEIWQAMGDSGKALRASIVWLIDAIKTTYNKALNVINRFFHGESLHYLSGLIEKAVEKYDKFVKDLHISFIKYVENLWNKFWFAMSNYWKSVLKRIEPYVFKFMTHIESSAWDLSKEVFDFIYKRTNELAESPYFNKVSSFTQDVDRLYRDIKSNDAITNIKKYTLLAWNFLKEKYFKLVPFGVELNEVLTEIWDEIKQLEKIEQMQIVIQKYQEIVAKLEWIAEELQLEARLHQIYTLLRNKFKNYALNALETADMYREAKTKFIFDPEVGIIDIEQKLPMSWHAFNETPKFEEIPEYKFLAKAQSIFSTTNSSLIRYLYNLRSHLDPKTWLPPYQARALLIGSRHYMTFDQRFIGLKLQSATGTGQSKNMQYSYLLAHDFFQRNFTLLLEPSNMSSNDSNDVTTTRKLSFIANGELIEIDLGKDTLSINGNSKSMLPLQLGDLTIYRELDVLTISSNTEFTLNCNVQFDICWFEVSGWYFGQTAGLLGTMNNEHYDEFTTSKSYIASTAEEFTDSWSLQSYKQQKQRQEFSVQENTSEESDAVETCHLFFKSGLLSACIDTVDPKPFYEMCLDLGSNSRPIEDSNPVNKGACTVALAYIEACTAAKIPLRVPDQCVFCRLDEETHVAEGTFVELSGKQIPRSTDVVFIVEAKPCNANLTESKNIMTVVSTLEEQLRLQRITDNRYAVLTFGGRAPFDRPRSIIHENRVFTSDINELQYYFDHIETNNGTYNDILQAISTASKLNFRPGVSKTFILLSCSDCSARSMRFDYTSILQYMLEEGVNLHILADIEFEFEKTRKLRHFFGLDRELVYSKRYLDGDAEVRKQIHIPKSNLGICTPLALETDGSVFSARKLMPERKYPIRRVATIFTKRIAKTALPNENQICECSGHSTGVPYMACSPKNLPLEKVDPDDYDMQFNEWEWEDEEEEMDE